MLLVVVLPLVVAVPFSASKAHGWQNVFSESFQLRERP